jgi:hypothetical protein
MPRLTITLSEERYRALREAAATRRKSLVSIIDESLEACGVKSEAKAAELVAQARRQAELGEDEAMAIALEEVRSARRTS